MELWHYLVHVCNRAPPNQLGEYFTNQKFMFLNMVIDLVLEQIINNKLGNLVVFFQISICQQTTRYLQELKDTPCKFVRCISVFHENCYYFTGLCKECLETWVGNLNQVDFFGRMRFVEMNILFYCENQTSDRAALSVRLVACKTHEDDCEELVHGVEVDSHNSANVGENVLRESSNLEVGVCHGCDELDDVVFQQLTNLVKGAVSLLLLYELLDVLNVCFDESQSWLGCIAFD